MHENQNKTPSVK
ncbi:unnamed protein product, partial [Rotaria sp. Silwood2]